MKFFLNPGHCPDIINGRMADSGAINTFYNLKEAEIVRDICNVLKFLLENQGHTVEMLQSNNLRNGWDDDFSYPCIITEANNSGADFAISVHLNAFNGVARGTETIVFARDTVADEMAECIQDAIVKKMDTIDRGVKYEEDKPRGQRLSFIMQTDMPAILIECCFIDSIVDVATIIDKDGVFQYAQAIYNGINKYLGE